MTAPPLVDNRLRIETPENVVLEFRLAGPATRMYAYALDLVLRWAGVFVLLLVGRALFPFLFYAADFSGFTFLILMFLLEWAYAWLFEAFWGGRTPGKKAVGLRVVKEGGYPLGFFDAMMRNLLRAADVLPFGYGVGLITMLCSPKLQRLGDLVAGTMVVREKKLAIAAPPPVLADVDPFERTELSGGHRPSERTLGLIDRFARRVQRLGVARANEVASILAPIVAERLGYRGEDIDSDPAQNPHRFLLRVLRTFGEFDEEALAEAANGAPPKRRRKAARAQGAKR